MDQAALASPTLPLPGSHYTNRVRRHWLSSPAQVKPTPKKRGNLVAAITIIVTRPLRLAPLLLRYRLLAEPRLLTRKAIELNCCRLPHGRGCLPSSHRPPQATLHHRTACVQA